jgi:hypothetical protein
MKEKDRIRIDIRHVDECEEGEYGTFEIVGNKKMLITVSLKRCNNQRNYLLTILHELLHAWIALLQVNKIIKISDRREHRLIEDFELYALRKLKQIIGEVPK